MKGENLSSFDVLMLYPMPPRVIAGIASRCTLHKLWEADDRDAALAELAPKIRGIATGGNHLPLNESLMGRLPALEIVASFGVGYDHVDAAWAGRNGIIVTHTPDVLNDEVADTTFGLLLNAVRRFSAAERHLRAGQWLEKPFPLTHSLRGRTMGILGLGRIGKVIAHRAEAFGLKVVYCGRRRQPDVAYPFYADLVEMARACSILVVIAPGGPDTKGIVNAPVFEALGPDGIFVNVARGSLVDEAALIEALREKRILTAALDVFDDEPRVPQALIDMEHIVLTPHVGSATHHTRDAMGQLVVDNLLSYAAGKGPLTPVPETPWPKSMK